MIIITCPSDNIPERTYAIDVLFNNLMGLHKVQDSKHSIDSNISVDKIDKCYRIEFQENASDYLITLDNQVIRIEDHFFHFHKEPLSYLSLSNIPEDVSYFHACGRTIPMVYGVDKFEQNDYSVTVGIDIFASTFFLLSRWEESLLGREDRGDCDETLLWAVKSGCFQRPIVHEYESFLRFLLCGNKADTLPNRKSEIILTHDVDAIITPSWKEIASAIIHRKSAKALVHNPTFSYVDVLKYKFHYPTEWSQPKMYLSLSEKYDIKDVYYFKVTAPGDHGCDYRFDDKRTIRLVDRLKDIKNNNIVLAFHPSENTFSNTVHWKDEIERIGNLLGIKPKEVRNHHLLYNYNTLRLLDAYSKEINCQVKLSNSVFHKRLGFRSGISVPFPLFDIFERHELNVLESPCAIMDTAMIQHGYATDEECWNDITSIVEQVNRYSGQLVLTWHILIRKTSLLSQYYKLCENTIEFAQRRMLI